MSDAFVLTKGLCDSSQVRSLVLASDAFMRMNDAFVRTSASFVLTKGVMTVVALGTAISFLSNKKPRRWARLFLFLLSIFRIPSLAIKPAKYLLGFWSGSDAE
jgi:multisubunit Na+/H+ antiporter MnhG subunit